MLKPRVSVVVPAYNLARYLPAALDSALTQQDPGGPVEIIVVDDGSTDETPAVLAGYGDRIRTLRQANAGLIAAVERGLQEVTGEYVALLDADDVWPSDRLARHALILDRHPNVGLVHGDMELIDAEGSVTHPSFFARKGITPREGRVLGPLIIGNFVTASALTFRSSLLPAVVPFESATAFPDWRIAVGIASVAEVVLDRGIASRYRSHGANMVLDASPTMLPPLLRRELPFRRWLLSEFLSDSTVGLDDVRHALAQWRFGVMAASLSSGGARHLFTRDPRLATSCSLVSAPSEEQTIAARVRALMHDPLDGALAFDLEAGLTCTPPPPVQPIEPPLATLKTRPVITLAALDRVIRCPQLLDAFAAETSSAATETLVILASPGSDLQPLISYVDAAPRLGGEGCDLQVITAPMTPPARALLAAWASARATEFDEPVYSALPTHSSVERLGTCCV